MHLHKDFAAALENLLNRRLEAHTALVDLLPPAAWPFLLGDQVFVILVLDITDVQKAVAPDAKVDEHRLDARLDIDHAASVNVPDNQFLAGAFNIQLLQNSVFHDRNPALFRLDHIDQHLFFHRSPFEGKGEQRA